jgi:hypothetical protein
MQVINDLSNKRDSPISSEILPSRTKNRNAISIMSTLYYYKSTTRKAEDVIWEIPKRGIRLEYSRWRMYEGRSKEIADGHSQYENQ